MGKDLLPPGTEHTRPLTRDSQRDGNIYGPLRYPEIGGFTSSAKMGKKTPFKQVSPGDSVKK
jgi:hypothetical protein